MKNIFILFCFFYGFSSLSYSLPEGEVKRELDKKGYVCSKEKILEKVLGLSKDECKLLNGMAISERAQRLPPLKYDRWGNASGSVHSGESSFRTGVVVVDRKDKKNSYFVPENNSCIKDGEDFLPNVNHSDRELSLIKKIGERISKIVKKSAIVVDIYLFVDKSDGRRKLRWHQDRFDGISDTDLLLFSVLDKQDLTENKGKKSVQKNYMRIGSIGEKRIHDDGFVGCIIESDVKKIKKITDKSGAGYAIDQRYSKNEKLLVHSRDKRSFPASRISMVVRTTILDDKPPYMFVGSGEDSYEIGFKRIYLSAPEVAKALFENHCEKIGKDKSELEKDLENPDDAQSYYKLMARTSRAFDGV